MYVSRKSALLFFIAILFSGNLFFSCKNFLDAGKTLDEIKKSIDYNNAKDVSLSIDCKEEIGIIYPQTSFSVKLGYDFEIQFLPNSDYYVIKDPSQILEAVSRTNTSVSRSDCVEFLPLAQTYEDAKAGLYRIKVKVLKANDDILIRPVCIKRPQVLTSGWRFSEEGFFANTPIVIDFDTPMINADGSLFNFAYDNDTVKLTNKTEDVSMYFEAPLLSSDGKQLKLFPKVEELKNYIGDLPFIDISISFGKNTKITSGIVLLPLVQLDQSILSIRYKSETESLAPKEYVFFVTRKPIDLTSADEVLAADKFLIKKLKDFSGAEEILKNRSNGTVYIYGKYYDGGSGVKSVIVEECQTNTSEGFFVESRKIRHEYIVRPEDKNFFTDEIGNTFFCIKFVSEFSNGAIQLDFSVSDACNNISQIKSFTIFKKAFSDEIFENIKISNAEGLTNKYQVTDEFDREEAYRLLKNITFSNQIDYSNYDKSLFNFYYNNELIELPLDSVTIKCVYKNDAEEEKTLPFEQIRKINNQSYDSTISINDIAQISKLKFRIIIADDMGNIAFKDFEVADSKKVDYTVSTSILEIFYSDSNFIYNKDGPHILIQTDEEETDFYASVLDLNLSNSLEKNYCYYILPKIGGFFIEIPSFKVIIEDFNSNNCENVIVKKSSLSKSKKTGYLDLSIEIDPDQVFDSVFVEDWLDIIADESSETEINYYFFEKEKNSITISIDSRLFYKAWQNKENEQPTIDFYVSGIREHKKSLTSTAVSFTWDADKYDNIFPAYTFARMDYEDYVLSITDESELETVTVKNWESNEEYPQIINSNNDYSIIIPVVGLSEKNNQLIIEASDIYGNTLYEEVIFDHEMSNIKFEEPSFEDVWWILNTGDYDFMLEEDQADFEAFHYLNNKWIKIDSVNCSIEKDVSNNSLNLYLADEFIPDPATFIKVITKYNYSYAKTPFYFYPEQNYSSKNDLIMRNGNLNDSVSLSSRAPVYVRTFRTTRPYNECKKWSIDEWEIYNDYFGETLLDFSPSDHSPQRYDIDLSQINSGENYCVIAHFANGKAIMSEIMQK